MNELKTIFVGTLEANIYTHSIADLYEQMVVGQVQPMQRVPTPEEPNNRMFEEFMRRNQQELDKLNSKKWCQMMVPITNYGIDEVIGLQPSVPSFLFVLGAFRRIGS